MKYNITYAKSSAFLSQKEIEEKEIRLDAYRKKKRKEMEAYRLYVKKRTSTISKKNKYNGQKIIAVGDYA